MPTEIEPPKGAAKAQARHGRDQTAIGRVLYTFLSAHRRL